MANESDFLVEAALDISATVQNIQAQLIQVQNQIKPIKVGIDLDTSKIPKSIPMPNIPENTSKPVKDLNAQLEILGNRAQGAFGNLQKYLNQNSQVAEKLPAQVSTIKDTYASLQDSIESGNLTKAKTSMQEMNSQITALKGNAREMNIEGKTFGETIGNDVAKLGQWLSATTLLIGAFHELQQGISSVIQMNTNLTNTAMAMNTTVDKLGAIATAAQNMSQSMGSNVNDILDIMHVYANVNETADSIIKKTQADVILSNISGMTGANTTDDLQAIQQQFNLTDDQLMHVDDAITTVAQNLRMNYQGAIQDIADGTKTAGAMAQQAGMTFEQFSSIVGATAEKTRLSGDEIANSMKMIMARVGQVKSADPNTTASDTSKATKALESIGLSNFDPQTNQLRNMYDVLSEVAAKWPELTKNQKAYISDSLAGQRQYSTFESIMLSFGKAQELATEATNANGNALKQQQTYMESTEAKIKTFNSTVASMWQNAISSKSVGDVVQLGTFLVQNIAPVLTTIIGLVVTLKAQSIESFITKIGTSISNIGTQLGLFFETAQEAGGGIKGLAAAFDTLNVAEMSVTGVLGILTTAFSLISMGVQAYNQEQQEAEQKALDAATNYKNESDSLSGLITQYQQLSENTNLTTEDKTTLKTIQDQLINTYGEEAKNLDLVNGKYDDQIQKIDQLSKAKANEYIRENQAAYNTAQSALSNSGNTSISRGTDNSVYQNVVNLENESNERLFQGTGLENDSGINGTLSERVKILGTILDRANSINNLTSDEKGLVSWVSDQYKTLNDQLTKEKSIVDQMNQAQMQVKFAPQMAQMTKYAQDFQNALKVGDTSSEQKATSNFQNLNQQIQNTKGLSKDLKQTWIDWVNGLDSVSTASQKTSQNVKNNNADEEKSNEDLGKSLTNLMKSNVANYQSLQSILDDVSKYKTLSSDNLNSLLKIFPDTANSVLEYNTGLKSTASMVDLIKQKMQSLQNSYKTELQQELAGNEDFYNSTISKHTDLTNQLLSLYGIDYKNYSTYDQLKEAIDNAILQDRIGNENVTGQQLARQYYSNVQTYAQYETAKENVTAQILASIQNANSAQIAKLAAVYGIDVKNFANTQQGKITVAGEIANKIAAIYGATNQAFGETLQDQLSAAENNMNSLAGMKDKDPHAGELYAQAQEQVNNLRGVVQAMSGDTSGLQGKINSIIGSVKVSIPSTTSALKSADAAATKAGKSAESAANKAEEAAKKAQEALENEFKSEEKIIEAKKEEDKYSTDKYGVEGLQYYNDLLALYNKWKNSKIETDEKDELEEKVLEAHKSYEQSILDTSYSELDTRVKLGKVQDNSKETLQNLLDIQKNLNSSGMSLVDTRENQLEIEEKIYDMEKQMREQDKSNINSLLSTTEDMLKKNFDTEKQQHQDRLDNIKKEEQAEKDKNDAALQAIKDQISLQEKQLEQEQDAHNHNEDQTEKEKAVSDIQAELYAIQNDNSDATAARRLSLEDKLQAAKKDLADEEYSYSIDQQKNALSDLQDKYEKEYDAKNKELEAEEKAQEDAIQKEEDAIDKAAQDEVAIRTQAMQLINSKSQSFYNQLIAYNNQYGVTIICHLPLYSNVH